MPKKVQLSAVGSGLLLLIILFVLFRICYLYDNKYTAGPPYGEQGLFSFAPDDLERPLFLIDGWMLSFDGEPWQETFIGEYSNFSFLKGSTSPFGKAEYRLELRCPGTHSLVLELPEIFTDYTLYVDGVPTAAADENTVDLMLKDKCELVLKTENYTHYYSGQVYPPILGTLSTINGIRTSRTIFYTALLVCALSLTGFSAVLWLRRRGEQMYLHFGLLCLCFATSCIHLFVWYAKGSNPVWYAIEDSARFLMLAEAIHLAGFRADWINRKFYRRFVRPLCLSACALIFVTVLFIIPNAPQVINTYGTVIDSISLCSWILLCAAAVAGTQRDGRSTGALAGGLCALGAAFLANLLNANRFEPIRLGWQTEYAGFMLVLLFGAMMAQYNRQILIQNQALLNRMEELVQERTRELHAVLNERKLFFSNMAHDLKAPIASVHNYILLMQKENLYLDQELQGYIHQIETGNEELARRIESLAALNTFDRITDPLTCLEVDGLLKAVQQKNTPDAAVMGIHLEVHFLNCSACIRAQEQKLYILFENLIFNAISFTPEGGRITIIPSLDKKNVTICVIDTGSGIAPEHLPHIFEQFYTARDKAMGGSGLGLYIARLTAEELGGSITASSKPGEGSKFTITLPLLL